MKQFRTVLKFEYTNYIKSKAFVILTVILLTVAVVGGNFPAVRNVWNSLTASSDTGADETPSDPSKIKKAAFNAASEIYDKDLLTAYFPGYDWERVTDFSNMETMIEDGEYELAISIDGLDYKLYQKGVNAMFASMFGFSDMIRNVYQQSELSAEGLSDERLAEILYAQPVMELVTVGKNLAQSFWLGYAMLFLLYFTIILYGQYVSTSVVTEKTSKAMELLITSSKPMPLMFGKVVGTGLAGLTQFGLFTVSALAFLRLNAAGWRDFSPMIGEVVDMSISSGMFVYALIFFLLGFFTFAFIYAGVASTVSRQEDAQSAMLLPMLVFVAAFFVAMVGMATPEAGYVKVCSYVPFLSPMVMFMRICVSDVSSWEILLGVASSVVYLLGAGWVSAKIYRVGIMLYGTKPKPRDLIRYIRNA